MAEIPQVGQAQLAIAQSLRNLANVKPGRGRSVRALLDAEQHEHSGDQGEPGANINDAAPGQRPDVHRVRQRRADGDGADHDAQGQSAPALIPAGEDLHSGRVNPGGGHASQEAEEQGQTDVPCRHHRKRGGKCRPQQARHGKDAGGAGQVEEVGDGQQQRPGYEAKLHGQREPRRQRQACVPLVGELRDHRRAGEPERFRQQFGEGDDGERFAGT